MYILLTIISAILTSLSQITSKIGINKTNQNQATLTKTVIILILSLLFIKEIKINIYIILSSIALIYSWIYYFKSLKNNKLYEIIPIFFLSTIIITIASKIIFNQQINYISLILIIIGNIIAINKIDKNAIIQTILLSIHIILLKLSKIEPMNAIFINSVVGIIILPKTKLTKEKNIIISSILTMVSWILYYKAINIGKLPIIVAIEKLNIIITLILSSLILKEKPNKKLILGIIVITFGTIHALI